MLKQIIGSFRSVFIIEIQTSESLTFIDFRCNMSEDGTNSLSRIVKIINEYEGSIIVKSTAKKDSRSTNGRTLYFRIVFSTRLQENICNGLIETFNPEELENYNYYKG